MEGSGSTVKIV